MPRKSRTQETESNVEPRVTRRSIRSTALPESPAKSPAPSPAKQGRKGKSTGASPRGKNKKLELEDIEDEIQVTPTKRGKKAVSSPRGRKSGKVKESAGGDGNEVTDEGKEVDNMEPVLTPSRSRRARAKPAEAEMPSPTRRSSRGAAKAAAAAIESQASAADEIEEDEEMDSSSKGIKRKAEDDDEKTEEKRQKLSEEATESEENKMEVENLEDKEDSIEATIKPSEEATSMDTVKNVEDPKESSNEKELADNQQFNVENKQSSEEPKDDENVSETVKDDTTEKDSDVPVNQKDTGANEMEVQTKPESENSKLPEELIKVTEVESEFVMIKKADVPDHQSSEVQQCLPKEEGPSKGKNQAITVTPNEEPTISDKPHVVVSAGSNISSTNSVAVDDVERIETADEPSVESTSKSGNSATDISESEFQTSTTASAQFHLEVAKEMSELSSVTPPTIVITEPSPDGRDEESSQTPVSKSLAPATEGLVSKQQLNNGVTAAIPNGEPVAS